MTWKMIRQHVERWRERSLGHRPFARLQFQQPVDEHEPHV
jgi:hypothetical protein